MQTPNKGAKPNYVRRGFGVLLFLLPFALITCSLTDGPFHLGKGLARASLILMILGLLFAGLNFYCSVIRPALLWHRPDYHFISVFPAIGTILVIAGALAAWSSGTEHGAAPPALLGLIALLMDTGGVPWFIVATWSDASLWDS